MWVINEVFFLRRHNVARDPTRPRTQPSVTTSSPVPTPRIWLAPCISHSAECHDDEGSRAPTSSGSARPRSQPGAGASGHAWQGVKRKIAQVETSTGKRAGIMHVQSFIIVLVAHKYTHEVSACNSIFSKDEKKVINS